MTVALVLLSVAALAVLLAVGLGAADRLAHAQAERHASEYLAAPLGKAARVRVHGSPFLTQALRGRYGDVEVAAGQLQLGALAGATLHAHLVGVQLPVRDLLGRRARELPVARVHGHLVIPYDELARISQLPGLRLRFRDGRLRAVASLPIPGISQLARVSGDAGAAVDETGGVWLRVRNLSVAGLSVPSLVLNQLLPTLAFPIPLPPLPFGLRLEQLTPTEEGLRVAGSARQVVFRAAG